MKGLQFQRLVLLSDLKRTANQFSFPKRFNLVTGNDNSIGKSTLVKSLFWAIGCDPQFDVNWKSNDVKAILYFMVNQNKYVVSRYADGIYFGSEGEPLTKYSKVTGQFAEDFAKVVGFDLMLANKQDGIDCPPPAFYFLPFYIDQKKSWDEPWNGFEKLQQYANFKQNLIKYFCGYLPKEHFDLEEEIFEEKALEKEANQQVERIIEAVTLLEEIAPEQTIAITPEEFEDIQHEIEEELAAFSSSQSNLYELQSLLANEIHELEQQLVIANTSAKELDYDYTFAVENIPKDSLECPLCGVEHDNSLLSRAGLLADKEGIEQQADKIKSLLDKKMEERTALNQELDFVISEIERINDKYLNEDAEEQQSDEHKAHFEQVIHAVSQHKVNQNVTRKKEGFQLKSQQANDNQKELKKAQRKLVKKAARDELNELFMGNLVESINSLSARGVNLDGVKAPMNYKKILGGGAAEGTRGTLAYQLAVLRQIDHANSCEIAPFVIDTPNQQEQAKHRYDQVMDVLNENIPKGYQVILCAMDDVALDNYKQDAHIIKLDNNRLLQHEPYTQLRAEYEQVVLSNR